MNELNTYLINTEICIIDLFKKYSYLIILDII